MDSRRHDLREGRGECCKVVCDSIKLLSLEVAAEKVPKVIQAVGSHVFKQKFSEAELPSKTSIQNMADEGHFIAQSYISSRLQNTDYWGIDKDGTSQNKR